MATNLNLCINFFILICSFIIYYFCDRFKKAQKKNIEHFENSSEGTNSYNRELNQKIRNIYNTYTNRNPTPHELSALYDQFKNVDNLTDEDILSFFENTNMSEFMEKYQNTQNQVDNNDNLSSNLIIDMYLHKLKRNPTATELSNAKTNFKNINELEDTIDETPEYTTLVKSQSNSVTNNELEEEYKTQVMTSYKRLLPKNDKPDKELMSKLTSKLKEHNNDRNKLEDYIQTQSFYKDYVTIHGSNIITNMDELNNKASKDIRDQEIVFKRPEINKSTTKTVSIKTEKHKKQSQNSLDDGLISVIDKHSKKKAKGIPHDHKKKKCTQYQELLNSEQMTGVKKKRDLQELEYACERSKEQYENLDDDMVLLPDQKWTIPHKRPPVCTSQKCSFTPLYEQSSLIGTLLSDATDTSVGSIMPSFKFKETHDDDLDEE